jgi:hypothetical protein
MPSILDPQNRRPRRRPQHVDPLVAEICEVLLRLGGSAPRELVIASLGENRAAPVDNALRARAVAVFDAHSSPEALTTNVQPLFRRPFGPGKHRWALTAEAEAFLRAGAQRRARLIGVVLDS